VPNAASSRATRGSSRRVAPGSTGRLNGREVYGLLALTGFGDLPAAWASVIAALLAALIATISLAVNATSGRRERRRNLYSEAYRTTMSWVEMAYRVHHAPPNDEQLSPRITSCGRTSGTTRAGSSSNRHNSAIHTRASRRPSSASATTRSRRRGRRGLGSQGRLWSFRSSRGRRPTNRSWTPFSKMYATTSLRIRGGAQR
jgi:hypothetical protein